MASHTDAIREAILEHGGIASSGQLRERWGLSKSRMHVLMQDQGFPKPVVYVGVHDAQALYSVLDADEFRARQRMRGT